MATQPFNGTHRHSVPPKNEARQTPSEFVLRTLRLPCDQLTDLWDRLVLNERRISRQDILQALNVQFQIAAAGMRTRHALHGTTLLYGPPGTGKTSIAIGAPNALMQQLGKQGTLLEINTHSLPGGERGACQKNICRLFEQLSEVASIGSPIFAVFNELETLASSRQSISQATNPLDTAFAVNALIESIDNIAAKCPSIHFLATTNIPEHIDSAIFDRFDDVFHIALPGPAERLLIIAQSIESLQPKQRKLAQHLRYAAALKLGSRNTGSMTRSSEEKLLSLCEPLIKSTKGLSPRRLSQLPVRCLGLRAQEFDSPLTIQQLISTATRMRSFQ